MNVSFNNGISEYDLHNDPNIPPYWHHYFSGQLYDLDIENNKRTNHDDSDDDDENNHGHHHHASDPSLDVTRFKRHFINCMVSHFRSNSAASLSLTSKNKSEEKNVDGGVGGGVLYTLKQMGRETVLNVNLDDVKKDYASIHRQLELYPECTIACMGFAAHKVFFGETLANAINIRLYQFYSSIPIKHLKASSVGRFVKLKGTVARVSNIKPVLTRMRFACTKCNSSQIVFFQDGKYVEPVRCVNRSCRSRRFNPDRSTAVTVDWQKIRIQEIVEDDMNHEAGRIPRNLDIEVTKDLVESCVPGDQIVVSGLVKMIAADQHAERYSNSRAKNTKAMYFIYLDGNSISNNKEVQKGHMDLTQFNLKDLKFIQDVSQEKDLFHLIVNSLCPAIFGLEMVKAGLCLGLFGGVQKYTNEKEKMAVRGDPHLLVVGDPGLGKSQLLTAVSHVAPRGVYVCGNTTTASGLTVTVVRDGSSGDYSLEAGALVLADQGTCFIDEFDKMKHEHQALLEAMEQQSISIAKAGIVCNLPARCSVIAAANPVGGHYNRAKTVSENLKISPALLSRFDLIFILLDRPDRQRDELLSNHVMNLHNGFNNDSGAKKSADFSNHQAYSQYSHDRVAAMMRTQAANTQLDGGMKLRLKEYLRPGKRFVPMPGPLLRKYIAYVRKYVHPTLSNDAKQVLQSYYLKLRQQYHTSDSTPITTRQLESLIRLAQARAKIELRDKVTEQDALDVIEIMSESLYDVLTDETGQVDLSRNSGYSKLKGMKGFIVKLQEISSVTGKDSFTVDELRRHADTVQMSDKFEELLYKANHIGYLLKQADRSYKFTATK